MTKQLFFVLLISGLNIFATIAWAHRDLTPGLLELYNRGVPAATGRGADNRRSLPSANWTVKYESGSLQMKPGTWLRVAFVPNAARAVMSTPILSLPADKLLTVEYSRRTERASRVMQGPRSGCSYAYTLMPDPAKSPKPEMMVAITVSLGRGSRWLEKLNVKHPIKLIWNDGSENKSLVVRVTDCEYQSLVANFRWLVGSRWSEVGHDSGR